MRWLSWLVAVAFIGSCWGYFLLEPGDALFLRWLSLYAVQFLLYLLAVVLLWKMKKGSLLLWVVTGILARVVLWFSDPVLETDVYRYLWDGRVLAHGINPYLYAPLDPALDGIDTLYRSYIGWAQFRTIYPPVAQYLFALSHYVAADSLLALKIFLTLFDLATGFLLIRWLQHLQVDTRWCLLYFLSPLVLKEVANSAHMDTIPVFFSFAALFLMSTARARHGIWAWIALALSVGAKLYPLVFVPYFVKLDRTRVKSLLLFSLTLMLLYAPFLEAGTRLFSGTMSYARYWVFNASLFQVTDLGLNALITLTTVESNSPMLEDQWPAKLLLGLAYCLALAWRTRKLATTKELAGASLWALGLLLILSPVVDSWYVLWLLPLACLERHVPWLAFSFLVSAAYSWFYSKRLSRYFRLVEYGVFYGLLAKWTWGRRRSHLAR